MSKKGVGVAVLVSVVVIGCLLLTFRRAQSHKTNHEYEKEADNIVALLHLVRLKYEEGNAPPLLLNECLLNTGSMKDASESDMGEISLSDTWGTDLRYAVTTGCATVISAGRDKTFGTDDDCHGKVNLDDGRVIHIDFNCGHKELERNVIIYQD